MDDTLLEAAAEAGLAAEGAQGMSLHFCVEWRPLMDMLLAAEEVAAERPVGAVAHVWELTLVAKSQLLCASACMNSKVE